MLEHVTGDEERGFLAYFSKPSLEPAPRRARTQRNFRPRNCGPRDLPPVVGASLLVPRLAKTVRGGGPSAPRQISARNVLPNSWPSPK